MALLELFLCHPGQSRMTPDPNLSLSQIESDGTVTASMITALEDGSSSENTLVSACVQLTPTVAALFSSGDPPSTVGVWVLVALVNVSVPVPVTAPSVAVMSHPPGLVLVTVMALVVTETRLSEPEPRRGGCKLTSRLAE